MNRYETRQNRAYRWRASAPRRRRAAPPGEWHRRQGREGGGRGRGRRHRAGCRTRWWRCCLSWREPWRRAGAGRVGGGRLPTAHTPTLPAGEQRGRGWGEGEGRGREWHRAGTGRAGGGRLPTAHTPTLPAGEQRGRGWGEGEGMTHSGDWTRGRRPAPDSSYTHYPSWGK